MRWFGRVGGGWGGHRTQQDTRHKNRSDFAAEIKATAQLSITRYIIKEMPPHTAIAEKIKATNSRDSTLGPRLDFGPRRRINRHTSARAKTVRAKTAHNPKLPLNRSIKAPGKHKTALCPHTLLRRPQPPLPQIRHTTNASANTTLSLPPTPAAPTAPALPSHPTPHPEIPAMRAPAAWSLLVALLVAAAVAHHTSAVPLGLNSNWESLQTYTGVMRNPTTKKQSSPAPWTVTAPLPSAASS